MYQSLGEVIEDIAFFAVFIYMLLMYYGAVPGKNKISLFDKYKTVSAIILWFGVLFFGGSIVVWLIK